MNRATPTTAPRSRRRWARGESGSRRKGITTSCTKMLLHECRYVLWVEMKAPTIMAAKAPSRPAGSSVARTTGPRIWLRTASLSRGAREARTCSATPLQSGWCITVKMRMGMRVRNVSWARMRHRESTPPILPSWAVRAEA